MQIFIQSISMKVAEMQHSDQAFPVGYMVGTTEKGIYRTVNEAISKQTGVQTEVSYQNIDQKGVTNKMWVFAKEKALEKFSNPYSREHKRLKFAFSPSALVIYVSR